MRVFQSPSSRHVVPWNQAFSTVGSASYARAPEGKQEIPAWHPAGALSESAQIHLSFVYCILYAYIHTPNYILYMVLWFILSDVEVLGRAALPLAALLDCTPQDRSIVGRRWLDLGFGLLG